GVFRCGTAATSQFIVARAAPLAKRSWGNMRSRPMSMGRPGGTVGFPGPGASGCAARSDEDGGRGGARNAHEAKSAPDEHGSESLFDPCSSVAPVSLHPVGREFAEVFEEVHERSHEFLEVALVE